MSTEKIREYVGSQIARYEPIVVHAPDRRGRLRKRTRYQKVKSGWTPIEAIEYAKDREVVEIFRCCAMLVALCQDEKARSSPEHQVIHLLSGVVGCAGPAMLAETARSLGISDARAKHLVDQLQSEWNATQGMIGGG